MVTILIAVAGQSGTSEAQSMMVDVIVLKTVEVVTGTEVSIGMAGRAVDNPTVELDVIERLSEAVGATIVRDSPLGAELATSLVDGKEMVSVLDSGLDDSVMDADELGDASEETTALDEDSAVASEEVGVEAG
jgi:hypothetical protein